MPKAIRIHRHGGPEVMSWEEVAVGAPGPGEARVRHTAVGLNFVDVYERTGLYPAPLPGGLGREAAGVIEAVGRGVRDLKPGDRVAYTYPVGGAYSEVRLCPARHLVRLPAHIGDAEAAALLLKGLTAYYLLRETYRVKRGDTLVFHAAVGGVGSIACRWARRLGARVIGVVGSEEKARLARRNGCHQVLTAPGAELPTLVRKLTRGKGVDVVYDSVGAATFYASLDCLRPRGLMVSFGNASGPAPAVEPLELSKRGSLFLTRPTLADYVPDRAALERAARVLFAAVKSGAVQVHIGRRYPLREASQAHRDLEARRTTGSTVLIP